MIRSSKRKFVNKDFNDNTNTEQWWDIVKGLTSNYSTLQHPMTLYFMGCVHQTKLSTKLKDYYKSVGGLLIHPYPDFPHTNQTDVTNRHGLSIGELKLFMGQ